MRLSGPWLIVVLLSACSLEAAPPTYTIKFKTQPDTGMTVTIRDSENETGSMRAFGADGKLLNEEKPKSHEVIYTVTVLQRKKTGALANKAKRVYEKATESEGGKARTFTYQGRTVVIEQKGNAYHVGVDGKPPLDEKDLDKLIKDANDDSPGTIGGEEAVIPNKAVAVGERWTINLAKMKALKRYDLDTKASTGEAKLVKVYTKGKSQFGIIEINFKLAVKGFGPDMHFIPPASMEQKVTIDTAIDGSSTARTETLTGKLKGRSVMHESGKKIVIEIDVGMSGRSVCSEEKDDARAREVPAVKLFGPDRHWAEFTSKEGRFSATFPGKPEVTKKEAKTSVTTECTVARERGNIAYTVIYTDYKNPNPNADPKAVLKSVIESNAKVTKKKKEIKLNGIEGVELVLELDQKEGKLHMTYRAYFVKGRLYQLMVIDAPGVKEKIQVEKFLDSFKLHDRKNAKKPGKDGKE
jgi:hypothetical protein